MVIKRRRHLNYYTTSTGGLDVFLGGRFFLRGFEVCFASWELDVEVVVTRTGHAGIGGRDSEDDVTVTEDVDGKSCA
ncbi:hypothetical protein TNCV_1928651 [Trichonephila clavipes]|nr:hypothetical protein TNCV_1928651 [Trichonephila clavipes]